MTIKVTYNSNDIYVSETISATYISVSYEAPSGGGGAVWGDIVGTLSNQADLQLVLDGKVPYTGAIANVNLGTYNLTAQSLRVNTSGQTTTITNFYPPTTDGRNIFIGGGGLNSVRIGRADDASENTAVGVNSLFSNTSGRDNTAIGHNSMYFTTTGQFNVAVGDSSLVQNTSGVRNSVLGQSALNINTTGNSNIAIGNLAGSGGFGNTTGSNNIFIGASAVGESATDSNRTFIGNNSTTSSWLGGKLLLGSRVDASSDILQATGTASVTSNMLVGQLTLNTTPSGTAVVGTTRWNDTIGSSETTLKGGSVILKNGVDLVARVVNKVSPNTTLTKASYQAVRVSGAQGQRLAIELAQANNDNNSADTIGLVTETIAPNQEGFIITVGQLENINTTGALQGETWVDGDVLYLSPTTAGRLTNVKPVAPNHIVVIGYVEYAHQNNGKIYVKVMNGWELGELHDVDTTGATNGQVLKYNGTIWTPSADSGITTLTTTGTSGAATLVGTTLNIPQYQGVLTNPITGTGAAGQVAYFTGATTQAGSNNLFWDNTNGRLGIGSATPSHPLNILSSNATLGFRLEHVTPSSASFPFQITNSADTNYIRANVNIIELFRNGGASTIRTKGSNNELLIQSVRHLQLAVNDGTIAAQLFSTGNLVLQNGGTFTDSGQRLQVIGDTLMRGSGNTSATTALTVQNSDGTVAISVTNDRITTINNGGLINGNLVFGTSYNTAAHPYLFRSTNGLNLQGPNNTQVLNFTTGVIANTFTEGGNLFQFNSSVNSSTLANVHIFGLTGTIGNGGTNNTNVNVIRIANTINQGSGTGITRGLFVNPTLTAAADWRSIEWSNNTGWGLYGAGSANNFLAGNTVVGAPNILAANFKISAITSGGPNFIASAGYGTATQSGYFYMLKGRGTSASPTSVLSGDTLGSLNFAGYFTTSTFSTCATISVTAASDFTSFVNPVNILFSTLSTSGTVTELMRLTNSNNLHIGTFTADSGERLQVTGNVKITGASSFGGNMTLSLNQNAVTSLTLSNTTAGTSSQAVLYLTTNNSTAVIGKYSSLTTSYKTILSSDYYLYNSSNGDITILNDVATGNIKFAAGGSSTAQMTLTSAGNLCIGVTSGGDFLNIGASTTAKAQIFLAAGTAPTSPANGDIWFDGTDLKMRIGGVTKTFTLV